MIANGSIITYQGRWTNQSIWLSASDMYHKVLNDLSSAGLPVLNSSASPTLGAMIGAGAVNVTLTLQVNNGVGFGAVADIVSIIRHFVYQEFGSFPDSDSVPYVQAPTQPVNTQAIAPGTIVATGQPNQAQPSPGTPQTSTWDTVKSWFSSAATGSTWLLAAVGLGFVGAVILIAKKE